MRIQAKHAKYENAPCRLPQPVSVAFGFGPWARSYTHAPFISSIMAGFARNDSFSCRKKDCFGKYNANTHTHTYIGHIIRNPNCYYNNECIPWCYSVFLCVYELNMKTGNISRTNAKNVKRRSRYSWWQWLCRDSTCTAQCLLSKAFYKCMPSLTSNKLSAKRNT